MNREEKPFQTLSDNWANPKQVEQYRAGKTTMKGFFVGQVMKMSKGTANPALVNELLEKKLSH